MGLLVILAVQPAHGALVLGPAGAACCKDNAREWAGILSYYPGGAARAGFRALRRRGSRLRQLVYTTP